MIILPNTLDVLLLLYMKPITGECVWQLLQMPQVFFI